MQIDHLAIAILRQADQIVMVQHRTPNDHQPYWVLPGGLVEAGEFIKDALIREVQEEVGVRVIEIGALAGISQIHRPACNEQTLAFVFEVVQWQGVFQCQDPDGKVYGVELVDLVEAIHRLQQNGGWPGVQTPLLAYLRGDVPAGTMWFYCEEPDGQRQLGVLSPAHK
jgi:8-oxo-dGTP pyrophosphatase MutT (NUDIX family)